MSRLIHSTRGYVAFFILFLFSLACSTPDRSESPSPNRLQVEKQIPFREQAIFISGEEGYHTFRIPALVATRKGALLAFCEGRKNGRGDTGDIDLVVRRSADGGETWGPLQTVWDDGGNTCGNPAPVVDRDTGTIWLLMTRNAGAAVEKEIHLGNGTRDVFIAQSGDDGLTWTAPVDISASVKKADWRWYATGPCHGVQLRGGRLVVPCDHSTGPEASQYRSHVIISDDRGKTWQIGGVEPGAFTNESTVVELADGSLYLNMRSYKEGHRRQVSLSRDGGAAWTEAAADEALVEPRCQASAIRYPLAPPFSKNRILFANPASEKRERMTVRVSYDEAKTWAISKCIYEGPSAYSDLAVLPNHQIGLLYERGEQNPYETISFARMTLEWLTGGEDE
jgi:sialidase-1